MSIVDSIRLHYPLPIARLFAAVQREDEPRLQVIKALVWFEGMLRHLSLIGLAGYTYYSLQDEKVEEARTGLRLPSMGHWRTLLKELTPQLESHNLFLLGDKLRTSRTNDAIANCTRILGQLLEQKSKPEKVTLEMFLEKMNTFRNKKHGHGELTEREAKQVAQPLVDALSQWLEELTLLQQHKMLYIKRVEFEDKQFLYRCIDLNSGDSHLSFSVTGIIGVPKERLYLLILPDSKLIPLYPWFDYDNDRHVLYTYSELSKKETLLLRCPYDEPAALPQRIIEDDATWVIGKNLLEQPSSSDPNAISCPPPVAEPPAKNTEPSRAQDSKSTEQSQLPSETFGQETTRVTATASTIEFRSGDSIALPNKINVTPTIESVNLNLPTDKQKCFVGNLPDLAPAPALRIPTFDELILELTERVHQVCNRQARYPVLWLVGGPYTGKTQLAHAACTVSNWKYINFTLDAGWFDSLLGYEETCRPEDILNLVRTRTVTLSSSVVVLDEIEPVLSLWPWDEQESFFSQISKATRLPCGLVLVTRLRSVQQLLKHLPQRNHVFALPEGVSL